MKIEEKKEPKIVASTKADLINSYGKGGNTVRLERKRQEFLK